MSYIFPLFYLYVILMLDVFLRFYFYNVIIYLYYYIITLLYDDYI